MMRRQGKKASRKRLLQNNNCPTDDFLTACNHSKSTNIRQSIMNQPERGWSWAYSKTRSYHTSKLQALYRATRYWVTGDTGSFISHGGFRKSRIRR